MRTSTARTDWGPMGHREALGAGATGGDYAAGQEILARERWPAGGMRGVGLDPCATNEGDDRLEGGRQDPAPAPARESPLRRIHSGQPQSSLSKSKGPACR